MTTDVHGNVIAVKNPDAPLRVMLAGHCDQIGLLVQHIDDEGFLYVQPIGGWDPQVLIGQKIDRVDRDGAGVRRDRPQADPSADRRRAQASAEAQGPVARHRGRDKDEAADLVSIGDPVTLELGMTEMRNHFASSPAMDDKAGLWVAIEALRRTSAKKLNCALVAVSTVQEEIGLRGATTAAYGIDPHVGIAVDVTHATDCPTIDKKEEGDVALGRGPVIYRGPNMNPIVVEKLLETAESRRRPLPDGRQRPGHAHRRQRDSNQPRRRGHGPGEHSQPLHAQPGGNDLAGRHRPRRRPAGGLCPATDGR